MATAAGTKAPASRRRSKGSQASVSKPGAPEPPRIEPEAPPPADEAVDEAVRKLAEAGVPLPDPATAARPLSKAERTIIAALKRARPVLAGFADENLRDIAAEIAGKKPLQQDLQRVLKGSVLQGRLQELVEAKESEARSVAKAQEEARRGSTAPEEKAAEPAKPGRMIPRPPTRR